MPDSVHSNGRTPSPTGPDLDQSSTETPTLKSKVSILAEKFKGAIPKTIGFTIRHLAKQAPGNIITSEKIIRNAFSDINNPANFQIDESTNELRVTLVKRSDVPLSWALTKDPFAPNQNEWQMLAELHEDTKEHIQSLINNQVELAKSSANTDGFKLKLPWGDLKPRSEFSGQVYLVGGTFGSGKSASLSDKEINPQHVVAADPIKVALASGDYPISPKNLPSARAHTVSSEVAFQARKILNETKGADYVYDGSLRFPTELVEALRDSNKQAIVDYSVVPLQQSLIRVLSRDPAGEDPRIPFQFIREAFNQTSDTVQKIKGWADVTPEAAKIKKEQAETLLIESSSQSPEQTKKLVKELQSDNFRVSSEAKKQLTEASQLTKAETSALIEQAQTEGFKGQLLVRVFGPQHENSDPGSIVVDPDNLKKNVEISSDNVSGHLKVYTNEASKTFDAPSLPESITKNLSSEKIALLDQLNQNTFKNRKPSEKLLSLHEKNSSLQKPTSTKPELPSTLKDGLSSEQIEEINAFLEETYEKQLPTVRDLLGSGRFSEGELGFRQNNIPWLQEYLDLPIDEALDYHAKLPSVSK